MNIGDLVRVKKSDTDPQNRTSGVILRFDVHHPDSSSMMIPIAEVLWNTGKSWIDRSRIEVICD